MSTVNVVKDFSFEIEIDCDIYYVEGSFNGSVYYSAGCMYRRNGDPGDPPEYDSNIDNINITSCTINDSDAEFEVIKGSDLYSKIECKCYELMDNEDIDDDYPGDGYEEYDDD